MTASGDVPEWQEIMERQLPYRPGEVPSEGLRLVMAVDVQKFSLYFVIRAFGSRGTSWLIECGQLYGPTEQEVIVRARDGAGRPRVIHVFEGLPGQVRGISPLTPALQVARQFDQLAEALSSSNLEAAQNDTAADTIRAKNTTAAPG